MAFNSARWQNRIEAPLNRTCALFSFSITHEVYSTFPGSIILHISWRTGKFCSQFSCTEKWNSLNTLPWPKDSQRKLTHDSFHLECERSVAPSCVTHWLAVRCWKCMSCDQSSPSSHFDVPYLRLWHAQQSLLWHCTVLRSRDEQSRDNIISRPHQKHIQSHNKYTYTKNQIQFQIL